MGELTFEYLLAALEASGTKGTAVATPTHFLNAAGVMTPSQDVYRPDESRGTLAEYYRSQAVHQWSEWSAEGPADVLTLPFLLEMCVKGGGVIATPTGGTLSRTHTYSPTMTADDLLAATLYWGDPNTQAFQSTYNLVDSLTLSADASSSDGARVSVKGFGRFPAKTAPGAVPSMLSAPLIAPSDMQLWIDTTLAIGTTEVTGRLVSGEATIPGGVGRKFLASGPAGGKNFTRHSRKKRHAELKLVMELTDLTQYDLWAAHTSLKVRWRLNGPVIEGALRHYIQVDAYGPFDALDWGDFEGSRTIGLNILSEYDATAGYDFSLQVQNNRATI